MKLRFAGYILGVAVEEASRSVSVWRNQIRKGDVGVLVIEYRNTVEKKKILEFMEYFEAHAPQTEDPE